MPSLVTTIEDFSPLLVYSTDWLQGAGDTDNQISKYSASSFFATSTTGGSVTFSFTGTGIEVFGSKRLNHGNYQVQLDGSSFPTQSGTAADPGTFQTSLFSRTNLNDGPHTIMITNQGTNKQFLDIDFITLRSSVGGIDEHLIMTTVQDDDPAFIYSPISSWSTTPDNLGTFSGGSGHSTPDGSMTFTFDVSGDTVSLYGPVGPSAASYVVQVDGGTATTSSATKARFEPGVLLYHGGNLGPGKHTLTFSCRPATGQSCSVDYAEVYTTESSRSASKCVSFGGAQRSLLIIFFLGQHLLVQS
ncbi:hypothetical protein L218DRAFT_852939 [Marasmius fiardii PR-910]|nr:hypothetical protein L218DRAFT_852939 [Marasmius fiardii PR-910]